MKIIDTRNHSTENRVLNCGKTYFYVDNAKGYSAPNIYVYLYNSEMLLLAIISYRFLYKSIDSTLKELEEVNIETENRCIGKIGSDRKPYWPNDC